MLANLRLGFIAQAGLEFIMQLGQASTAHLPASASQAAGITPPGLVLLTYCSESGIVVGILGGAGLRGLRKSVRGCPGSP